MAMVMVCYGGGCGASGDVGSSGSQVGGDDGGCDGLLW